MTFTTYLPARSSEGPQPEPMMGQYRGWEHVAMLAIPLLATLGLIIHLAGWI